MGSAVKVDIVRGIQKFKRRVPRETLAEAFKTGDYIKTMSLIPWEHLDADLAGAIGGIKDTVGHAASVELDKMSNGLRFDLENPYIARFIHERSGELITGIEGDARANISAIIADSFLRTKTPRQLADQIKDSIGLLPAHARALTNYKAGLEEKGLGAREIEKLGDAYEERLLDYRANSIARTETRQAVLQGQLSVWRQGVSQGLIEKAEKELIVDGNPCDICEPMDGTRVPLDEPFIVDGEEFDGPPFHTHCECGLELHFADSVLGEEAGESDQDSDLGSDEEG